MPTLSHKTLKWAVWSLHNKHWMTYLIMTHSYDIPHDALTFMAYIMLNLTLHLQHSLLHHNKPHAAATYFAPFCARHMRFQRKIIFHVHVFSPLVLGSVNLLWICADKLKTRLPCVYVHVTCWWGIITRDLDTNLAVPQGFLRRVFAWIFTVNKSALEISFKHFDLSFSWHSWGWWYFFLTFTRQINFPSSLKATLSPEMYPLR